MEAANFSMTESLARGVLRSEHHKASGNSTTRFDELYNLHKQKVGPRFREGVDHVRAYIKGREALEMIRGEGKKAEAMWLSWAPMKREADAGLRFCSETIFLSMRGRDAGYPCVCPGQFIATEHVVTRVLQRLKSTDFKLAMSVLNAAIVPLFFGYITDEVLPNGQFTMGVPGGMIIGKIEKNGGLIHLITFVDQSKLKPAQIKAIGESTDIGKWKSSNVRIWFEGHVWDPVFDQKPS